MINAPYEKEFVFHDGRRAKNLLELSSMLENIGQEDFERFVNTSKNDFANWIEYVLLDKELASSLRSTTLFSKTKELISNKIMSETNSAQLLNDASNEKKSFFKILRPRKNTSVVEVRKPIEEIPEPRNHEMLNVVTVAEKKRWFRRKEKADNLKPADLKILNEAHVDKEINEINNSQDKYKTSSNPLRKWYQFNRRHLNKRTNVDINKKNAIKDVLGQGNIAWVLLYCVLIFSIIAIIVYKFVL